MADRDEDAFLVEAGYQLGDWRWVSSYFPTLEREREMGDARV